MTGSKGALNRIAGRRFLPEQGQIGPQRELLLDHRCGIDLSRPGEFLERRCDRSGVDYLIAVVGLQSFSLEAAKIVLRLAMSVRASMASGLNTTPAEAGYFLALPPFSRSEVLELMADVAGLPMCMLGFAVSACAFAFQLAQMGACLVGAFVNMRRQGPPI